MQFQYAESGNVAALRTWLHQHPERVNIPSAGSQYTLLYTAVCSGQLAMVRMLMGEFKADPGIPCGGIGNTPVHAAALAGDVDMLSYLLACGAPLRPNAFSEYPIDMAKMPARGKTTQQECVKMLLAYEQRHQKREEEEEEKGAMGQAADAPRRPPPPSPPLVALRNAIHNLRVDSDEEEEKERGGGQRESPMPPSTPPLQHSLGGVPMGSAENGCRSNGAGNRHTVMPRNECNITTQSVLPLDLHTFRRVYGNGFEFAESTHTYSVRGLLPYTFKGVVYYTPVILIVRKPLEAKQQQQPPQQYQSSSCRSAIANGSPRYRALIDRKRLNSLFISRRATYIDPCTAAILPSEVDVYYRSLLEFVQHVVIANFERVPPLTHMGDTNRAVEENAPLFRLYPNERELQLRILRELSTFCDNAFTYNRASRAVCGFLPLFGTSSQAAADGMGVSRGSKNTADAAARVGSQDAIVVTTELLMKLPLRLQFSEKGNFREPPVVYFVNATNKTPEERLNHAFLSKLIVDGATGEMHRGALAALDSWKEHGSLLEVLSELQKVVTSLLLQYCRVADLKPPLMHNAASGALMRRPHSCPPPHPATAAQSGQWSGSRTSTTGSDCDADWLLVVHSAAGSDASSKGAFSAAPKPNSDEKNIGAKCVICLEAEKNILLLPCRHLVLCRECSLRYKDRLGDGMLCPTCRTPITQLIEIYV
ncbi:hypothetical protein DQ04_04291020 [Trypanosoma grayi]|uniref:hypothetical protein n=1 Tax=Trypanosoma grayi TaxID=71804 RepID=UPI0004F49ED1|nr:hypothetical protein DQ04_04291020 [Trypanosoma grayi]KEG10022.1 hypothetical protein DQ04_04291020 [Trypanosoma grayi]